MDHPMDLEPIPDPQGAVCSGLIRRWPSHSTAERSSVATSTRRSPSAAPSSSAPKRSGACARSSRFAFPRLRVDRRNLRHEFARGHRAGLLPPAGAGFDDFADALGASFERYGFAVVERPWARSPA